MRKLNLNVKVAAILKILKLWVDTILFQKNEP